MILLINALIFIILFAYGACIFSFLNVVIYRVPKKKSFVKGFSACPGCNHRLYPLDLIPIFSWLGLRGRCRYCKTNIALRYTLVELLGGILAVLCAWRYGLTIGALTVFAFLCMLTAVSFVDIDTMEIPNGFVLAIFIIGLVSLFTMPQTGLLSRCIGAVCVSGVLLVVSILVPGGFGGGDIKLMAASGFFLGWAFCLTGFFIAVLTGGIYGMYLLAAKKKSRKDHFAFGPFLCIGMAAALFFGNSLITWYLGLLPGF